MEYKLFESLAKPGVVVPIFRRISADFLTPVMAYLKLRARGGASFLLESAVRGEQVGRYSFIGCGPERVLASKNGITTLSAPQPDDGDDSDFFTILHRELSRYKKAEVEHLPGFTGGAVGFIGYEMTRCIEVLPEAKGQPGGYHDAAMAFYDKIIAFDHLKNEVLLVGNVFVDEDSIPSALYKQCQESLDVLLKDLNGPVQNGTEFSADTGERRSNFNREDFEQAVGIAREHIYAGDIFQVVLSQKFSVPYKGDAFHVYRALRNINPSPYMFYLDFNDYQIIGSSPESVISSCGDELEIIPIAGTRHRGTNEAEDKSLADALLADPKENAEHLMLVDLARNDMGRVSRHGSVKVEDFRTVEKYSHVMHLISRVKGLLQRRHSTIDAFKAAFPAGTVSGAPKIRAMEIINELEPDRRGYYAGAAGYFDYGGNMDMAIAIRTLLADQEKLYYQAGAGIVADSVPAREFDETINKSKALLAAIERANGGIHDFIHR